MYGLCSHRLSSTNAMISQWVGRRKKKISTYNFRLFITPMDLIGLRCLYTLSLIKLITRNPPLTIVSFHSVPLTYFLLHTHTLTPPFTFNQRDDKRNGPFIRPFTHTCVHVHVCLCLRMGKGGLFSI